MSAADLSRSDHGPSRRRLLAGLGTAAAGAGLLGAADATPAHAAIDDGRYYSFGPERIFDTRSGAGGRLTRGTQRTFTQLVGNDYTMVCLVTVIRTVGSGHIVFWNADLPAPPGGVASAVVRWPASNQTISATVFFDIGDNGFTISCGGSTNASTDVVLDSIGYFTGAGFVDETQRRWQEGTRRRLRG